MAWGVMHTYPERIALRLCGYPTHLKMLRFIIDNEERALGGSEVFKKATSMVAHRY
jgi:hypothetical protein